MQWNRPTLSRWVAWRVTVLFVLLVGMNVARSQNPAQPSDCSLDAIRSVLAAGYLARVRGCSYDTVAPLLNRYDLSPRRENVASSEPTGTIVDQDPDPQGLTSRGAISTVRLFVSDGSISPRPAETARVDVALSLQPPTDLSGLAEGDVKLWLVVTNRGPANAEATRVEATLHSLEIKRVWGGCEAMPCTVVTLGATSAASIFLIVTPLNTGDGARPMITFVATPAEREAAPGDNTVTRSFAAKVAPRPSGPDVTVPSTSPAVATPPSPAVVNPQQPPDPPPPLWTWLLIALGIALALLVVAGATIHVLRRRRWARLLRVNVSLDEPGTYDVGSMIPAGPSLAVFAVLGDQSAFASSPLPVTVQGKLDG